MKLSIEEIKSALSTKSGLAGLVAIIAPLVNPWLQSKGYPSFTDAQGNLSSLSFVLAGAWMIFNRAAIANKSTK